MAAELAANARTSDIPIIIVTGTGDMFDERRFAAVLRKPVAPDRLAATVDHTVKREPQAS